MMDDRFKDPKFVEWAYKVKEKFNFICQICKTRGGYLVSHHLNSWDKFVDERYDVENGVCVCKKHHEKFHEIYGFGNNNKFQFEEYQKFLSLIKELVKKNNEKI